MAIFSNKKTIFITGAGSGLGKGTAIGLARAGHKVIATVETISQVPEFRQYAESEKLDIHVFKLDVNNPLDRAQVEEHDFDIFVSNAGIGHTGPFAEVPIDNVRQVFETNFFSAIELAQIAARKFVAKKKGKIVFTSSIAGLSVNPFLGPYCASKHALEALAQALQQELESYGVQVATINPGPYKTGFNDMMFEEKEKWYDEKTNFTKRSDLMKGEQMLAQQFDPQDMIDKMVEIIPQDKHDFRTVWPEASEQQVKTYQAELWEKKI